MDGHGEVHLHVQQGVEGVPMCGTQLQLEVCSRLYTVAGDGRKLKLRACRCNCLLLCCTLPPFSLSWNGDSHMQGIGLMQTLHAAWCRHVGSGCWRLLGLYHKARDMH